ncbi:YdcF family protein [Mesorhizobium sp. CC13]|uniref:YdcF family protein n=1 Tax=Mesorhizobium sp. CC13 TaxID=3029194 RepID=UPI003263B229
MGQDALAASGTVSAPRFSPAVRGPRRRTIVLRRLLFVLVIAALVFAGGFGIFATHVSSLNTPGNPSKADAIIVLTGGQSRLDAAMDLLKADKGERLLISGVHPSATRRQLQLATGSDKALFNRVDIDRAALDTIGNAVESAKWVQSHAYQRVILVTNNYHMPRSLLELGRLLPRATLDPYPVVNTRLDKGNWLAKPEALRVLFIEYNKYLLALARGIVPVKPSAENMVVVQAEAAE